MHWAAMFVAIAIRGVAPALFGVGLVAWGLVDRLWPAVGFGAVLALSLGWMSLTALKSAGENQEAEQELLARALRQLLVS
jgi:hypothetical protein